MSKPAYKINPVNSIDVLGQLNAEILVYQENVLPNGKVEKVLLARGPASSADHLANIEFTKSKMAKSESDGQVHGLVRQKQEDGSVRVWKVDPYKGKQLFLGVEVIVLKTGSASYEDDQGGSWEDVAYENESSDSEALSKELAEMAAEISAERDKQEQIIQLRQKLKAEHGIDLGGVEVAKKQSKQKSNLKYHVVVRHPKTKETIETVTFDNPEDAYHFRELKAKSHRGEIVITIASSAEEMETVFGEYKKKAPAKVKKSEDEAPTANHKIITLSVRLTEDEISNLDDLCKLVSESTSVEVSRSWVIRELLKIGTPVLTKKYK